MANYHVPKGGLPPQTALMDTRAVFTAAYAVLPASTMRDITTSRLPHWRDTRAWIIARPMSGFSETFSHYVMDVAAGGGSDMPEPDALAQSVIFVVDGALNLNIAGANQSLRAGGYAYIPAAADWSVKASAPDGARFHWIRKRYETVDGIAPPRAFVTRDQDVDPIPMPDTEGRWATTRFVDPDDMAHDMHINIVTFQPGGVIPFPETHVMEHGLFVLEGKAAYKLNQDWVEVEAGDFMWLRAFCPQACYAAGSGPFRYLLYKDVNRHARLGGVLG